MESYVDRLLDCGWNEENARYVVEDLCSELGIFALEDFVRMEEKNVDKIQR